VRKALLSVETTNHVKGLGADTFQVRNRVGNAIGRFAAHPIRCVVFRMVNPVAIDGFNLVDDTKGDETGHGVFGILVHKVFHVQRIIQFQHHRAADQVDQPAFYQQATLSAIAIVDVGYIVCI
jgi:hypothetical protein